MWSVELVLITQHRAEVLAQRSAKYLITLWLGLSCFFYFSFLSTLNFSASAARIVIYCTMKKCPKAGISYLMLRDQSLAESRCQMALCKTGNWELLCLEIVVCKCYPALGSYRALHTDTRTVFLPTASLPVLPQSTKQFPDQEMVTVVVGVSHHRGPLCQPFESPENTWICLMYTMRPSILQGLPSAWPSTLGKLISLRLFANLEYVLKSGHFIFLSANGSSGLCRPALYGELLSC